MIVLGIDPDTKATGLALVEVVGAPAVLAVATACVSEKLPVQQRVIGMASAVANWIEAVLDGYDPDVIVVENQKKYPNDKVRPQDLIHLGQVAGICLAGAVDACLPQHILFPMPQDWKGTIGKEKHQARILSKVGTIDFGHHGIKPTHVTHVIDAIGLALWGAERAALLERAAKRRAA